MCQLKVVLFSFDTSMPSMEISDFWTQIFIRWFSEMVSVFFRYSNKWAALLFITVEVLQSLTYKPWTYLAVQTNFSCVLKSARSCKRTPMFHHFYPRKIRIKDDSGLIHFASTPHLNSFLSPAPWMKWGPSATRVGCQGNGFYCGVKSKASLSV